MGEWGCSHYYVDSSGGFGWPSCILCGQAPPSDLDTVVALRRCCDTPEAAKHTPTCQSVDARRKRGQPGLRGLG